MSSTAIAPYRVTMAYHPTLHVPDLDAAADFFARVFGRPSTNLSVIMPQAPAPGHSVDHAIFTMVGDALLETVAPSRYRTGGTQRWPDVAAGELVTTGWFVENVAALYRELRAAGIRVVNARDDVLEDPEWTPSPSPFYGHPEDTGLRYPFFEPFPFPLDPRLAPGWSGPELDPTDPLGIVGTAHHTIVSSSPDRALRLFVDVLGGTALGAFRDEARGRTGPAVRLADAVYHVAIADTPGSPSAPDHYEAITWRVADLDRVAAHLTSVGAAMAVRTADTIITDPTTSLGIPWGFTTKGRTDHGH